MTIDEKLKKETGASLHFYKEGVFWIAYEQSAFARTRQTKINHAI